MFYLLFRRVIGMIIVIDFKKSKMSQCSILDLSPYKVINLLEFQIRSSILN